jgi:hypothetical protein
MKFRRVTAAIGYEVQVRSRQGWIALADLLDRLSPRPAEQEAETLVG